MPKHLGFASFERVWMLAFGRRDGLFLGSKNASWTQFAVHTIVACLACEWLRFIDNDFEGMQHTLVLVTSRT